MSYTLAVITANEGGPGSGNHGHAGRPGLRGGSKPGSGIQHLTEKRIRQVSAATGQSRQDVISQYEKSGADPREIDSLYAPVPRAASSYYPRNPSLSTRLTAPPPPPKLTSEELESRLAYALRHEDPEVRVRAKSAKALYKSGDNDIRELAEKRITNLPAPRQEQVDKVRSEAVTPFQHVPEAKKGESFTDHALRTLGYVTGVLDKPRRTVVGALAGKPRELGNLIPFSDTLGITRKEDETSGRDLLEKYRAVGPNTEGFDWGDVAGFGVDAALDPLMWAAGLGAVGRSAKLGDMALTPARLASLKRSASYTARTQVPKWVKAGKSPLQVRHAYRKYYKYALDQEKKYNAYILAKRANRAKPVRAKMPESLFGRAAKTTEEAAAAQAAKAGRTGGARANPAAAAWIMLKHLKDMPASSEALRRAGKYVGRKLGKVIKQVRDTEVPERLLRTTPGVGKVPTTIGQVTGKVVDTVVTHPKTLKTVATAHRAAKYANELHQVGRVVQEATAEKEALKAARYNQRPDPDIKLKETTENAQSGLNYLVVNLSGNVRREKWKGEEYLVAPLSLIVEGVLNGSKGALHYPMTEMKKSCKSWEGTPIVVYHPMKDGRPQRARGNAEVLNKSIGVVRFPQIKHPKLVAEGWFKVDQTRKVDQRVYNALINGHKMELSTGLDTDNEPANNGSAWNGRGYTHIAKNYRPDHLAILPDQQGACSLNDGCGLGVLNNRLAWLRLGMLVRS